MCVPRRCLVSNLFLNIAFSTIASLVSSILTGQISSVFVASLSDGAVDVVGFVAAAGGLTMLALAIPVGLLTDRWARSTMFRIAFAVGAAGCAVTLFAVYLKNVPLLYASYAALGAFSAVSGAPLATMLADSTDKAGSNRTGVFVCQFTLGLLSGAGGPAIGLCFFLVYGDNWDVATIQKVLFAGSVLFAASLPLLLLLRDANDDDDGGGEAAAAEKRQPSNSGTAARRDGRRGTALTPPEEGERLPLLELRPLKSPPDRHVVEGFSSTSGVKPQSIAAAAAEEEATTAGVSNIGHQTVPLLCCTARTSAIPYLIFASDMTLAIGAGMTVQFFSLFFKDDFGASPVVVSAIFCASPVCVALLSGLAIPLGRLIGRAAAAVFFNSLGTACLFLMTSQSYGLAVQIALYLVRTAAMNAAYPLQRAIVMDVVGKKQRGIWSSLENLTSATWAGSAALGGFLISAHDYRFTFLITAGIYVAATAILALVVPLTWGEKPDAAAAAGSGGKGASNAETAAAQEVWYSPETDSVAAGAPP